MPKTLHRKIRSLEDAITREMNPALERAERTKRPEDCRAAIEKVNGVIALAKRLRRHVSIQIPPAASVH